MLDEIKQKLVDNLRKSGFEKSPEIVEMIEAMIDEKMAFYVNYLADKMEVKNLEDKQKANRFGTEWDTSCGFTADTLDD